jgi:hypothetical protein
MWISVNEGKMDVFECPPPLFNSDLPANGDARIERYLRSHISILVSDEMSYPLWRRRKASYIPCQCPLKQHDSALSFVDHMSGFQSQHRAVFSASAAFARSRCERRCLRYPRQPANTFAMRWAMRRLIYVHAAGVVPKLPIDTKRSWSRPWSSRQCC